VPPASSPSITTDPAIPRPRRSFAADFRHFFLRGLTALLPTLITLWLLVKAWDFLWQSLGRHLITFIKVAWRLLTEWGLLPRKPIGYIDQYFEVQIEEWKVELLGVVLAILLVYIVGLLVGNLIGRTLWGLAEIVVMRVPIVRAVYPAVKQITDFVLAERKGGVLESSRVVAVQPHEKGIWSIGLVTGPGVKGLGEVAGHEMVTVFVPSSPTAFSGYVLVVPRSEAVELPMTVEEAMRLLVSGGVLSGPGAKDLSEGVPLPPSPRPVTHPQVSDTM
jgi:uncharacterized membrane protein